MCFTSYLPKDKIYPKQDLQTAYENNPDGAGFAYSKDGKLFIEKGFFTFDSFWEKFNSIQEGNACIVHFRIGTAGKKDENNCHPFLVNRNCCFSHNGIMSNFTKKDSDFSDTWHFNDSFVKPLVKDVGYKNLWQPLYRYITYNVVGDGNKIIFFDKDGNFSIINEEEGEWVDGIWYSNNSYKTKKKASNQNTNPHYHFNHAAANDTRNGKLAIHLNGKEKWGYVLLGEKDSLLTEWQIRVLIKKHGLKKTKHLVKKNIIKRVVVDDNMIRYCSGIKVPSDREMLNEWLRSKMPQNELDKLDSISELELSIL